jgi:GDPmannose 4,6-dehydratase
LGNLDAKRDWGHAKEYVKAMWAMLQQDKPDDYVICSVENHSVKEFCEKAFTVAGLDYREHVKLSEKFLRPAEVDNLLGDSSKAKKKLGWKHNLSFDELVREMVESDLEMVEKEEEKKV